LLAGVIGPSECQRRLEKDVRKKMGEMKRAGPLRTRLSVPFDEAVARTVAALQVEGFGVLTEIDVQATLRKKLDVDFRKYVILGACNPPLAYQALTTVPEIGLLLPCNVIVYEDGSGSVVSIVDPLAMLAFGDYSGLEPVAQAAREKLARVVVAVQS
jgi:uncharacterized protein (DUF302 family)